MKNLPIHRIEAPPHYELWAVDLRDASQLEAAQAALSSDERFRAARFRFDRDRRRYVIAHGGLRHLLAKRTGLDAATLRWTEGPFGKPRLTASVDCGFNLSHSDDIAWIVLSDRTDVGVDVEVPRALPDADELAQRHFTVAEYREWVRLDGTDRDGAFLVGWTRKEACLKALGCGLSIDTRSFEVGLRTDARVVGIETQNGPCQIELHSIVRVPGAIGAVARVL